MGALEQPPAFEQLLGRVPSPRERERLLRLQKALQLKDDDAMWAVGVILQDYDAAMREELDRVHHALKLSRAEVARNNQLVRELLEAVRSTDGEEPKRTSRTAPRWPLLASAAALVLFVSSLCITVGYTLGSGGAPPWVVHDGGAGARAASAVLSAPAGWLLLLLLVPVSGYLAREAWGTASDEAAAPPARLMAWGLVGLSGVSAVALAALLRAML